MTFLGYIFWSILVALVGFGFWYDKKYHFKEPTKSSNQDLHESEALTRHNHNNGGENGPFT